MRKVPLVTALTIGSLLLISQSKSQNDSGLIPIRTILTIEARHQKDTAIPVLGQNDVMAFEHKNRLPVSELLPFAGANAGLDLFLLLDDASNSNLGLQFEDLRQFIATEPETTSIGLGYMHNGTVDVVQEPTKDRGRIAKTLRLPFGTGGVSPSPWLSTSELIGRWQNQSPRREIIIITSGIDPLGGFGVINPYLDGAIEDAQRNGIVVYAIYMPSDGHSGHSFFRMTWGQNHLAQIAEETGGDAYMLGFGDPIALSPYLNEISKHLQHQYAATFLMKPQKKAGFRDVRFTTEVPNAEIVAATRVYVPAEGSKRMD